MPQAANRNESIDPALVAAIVRRVIKRLQAANRFPLSKDIAANLATTKTNQTAASISDRIVTVATLEQLPEGPKQLFLRPSAIVTPAARDEARRRGITLNHAIDVPSHPHPQPDDARVEIVDIADPERASAVENQLARRGISAENAKIVLSDTPAKELYDQCVHSGEVAVMIGSIADVQRFADELSPTLWVLDMKRLNFAATVNVVAEITKTQRRA